MDSATSQTRERNIRFGPFRLSLPERAVWAGIERVELGSRAFEILALLVRHPGEVISRRQFQESVWPDTVVEDGNLRVHIARIRKALATYDGSTEFIQSSAGLGYRFVAPIEIDSESADGLSSEDSHLSPAEDFEHALGRRREVLRVVSLLADHPIVTVTGTGGVGKTTVCTAALKLYGESYQSCTLFVDLSSLEDGHHVETAVAAALNLTAIRTTPLEAVLEALRDREILIALDCCEQVIEGVRNFASTVGKECRGIRIIATSREPLRITGEKVFQLLPLPVPEDSDGLTATAALNYASVRLFIKKARASDSRFTCSDMDLAIIVSICRKIDGLPLAIELAASRITAFSLEALRDELTDQLSLLVNGRRTAAPRHQALRATIDWSYRLLSEKERRVISRLSIYRGDFTVSKILAVNQPDSVESVLADTINALREKSLIMAVEDETQPQPSFRLLDSIRTFCAEKLLESGSYPTIADLHLRYFTRIYTEPYPLESKSEFLHPQAYNRRALDDLRGALRWSLNRPGKKELDLFWASAPIFFMLGLVTEYRTWLDQAVRSESVTTPDNADSRYRLLMALGLADFLTQNLHESEEPLATERAYQIAKQFSDVPREMTALGGIAVARVIAGDYRRASRAVTQFGKKLEALPRHVPYFHNLTAIVTAQKGDFPVALRHARLADSTYRYLFPDDLPRGPVEYDTYHHLTLVQALESRLLWQMGRFDDAAEAARASVKSAVQIGQPLTLCFAIATGACPVACWSGDLAELNRLVQLLDQVATDMSLVLYRDQVRYGYAVALQAGGDGPAEDIASEEIQRLAPPTQELIGTISRHHLTPLAIKRAESGEAGAAAPEILRNVGENILARSNPDLVQAQTLFRRAIQLAQKGKARAWELRATTSLASCLAASGNRVEARGILQAFLEQQKQGLAAPDVIAAHTLLNRLLQSQ